MPELLRIDHQSNVDAPTKAKALIAQAQSAYLLSPSQNGGKRIFPLAVQSEMFECTSWSFDEDTPRAAASSLYAQRRTSLLASSRVLTVHVVKEKEHFFLFLAKGATTTY